MARRRCGTRPAAGELLTLKGHAGPVCSVSWSPDGTRLATGSEDGTAKVWDAAGGRELLTLKGHTGWVRSVSWSPDGTRLATGSEDGTAKVWDAAGGRGTAHPQGAYGRGQFRVLVAGRDAAGDRECGWHGEGVGRGRRPGAAHPQGAYGRGLFRVLVAGRDAAGDRE